MLRIEGYVIVSADGMLADASHVMPEALKFRGDLDFFTAGLDHADVVVHGRNSFEDQPNSPLRKRKRISSEGRLAFSEISAPARSAAEDV